MAAVSLILPFLNFSSSTWRGVALHFRNRFNLIGREHSAIREGGRGKDKSGSIGNSSGEVDTQKATEHGEKGARGEQRNLPIPTEVETELNHVLFSDNKARDSHSNP